MVCGVGIFSGQFNQIPPVVVFRILGGKVLKLRCIDVTQAKGNLLHAGDLESLSFLDRSHEAGGLLESFMGSGIQPGKPPAQKLNFQAAPIQISPVDVRDLHLAAGGRLKLPGDIHHLVVIKIKAGHRILGTGPGRFFHNIGHPAGAIKLNDAVTFGIAHQVAKNQAAGGGLHRTPQNFGKTLTVKNIVPQNQAHRAAADKRAADDKGLGQPFGPGLFGIGKGQSQPGAVTKDFAENRQIMGRGNNQNLANSRHHQNGKRVVNHGFVVNRQQLFADTQGKWIQPGS